MKLSMFNNIIEDEELNNIMIFNSLTSALAMISDEELNIINELKEGNHENLSENINFIVELKKGGFVIEDDIDEIETFKYLQKTAQFSNDSLDLTIAPTLGCNFACEYCYQGEHNSFAKMNDENQKSLIEFIESYIGRIKRLNITWYGGEPLLAMDIIESLTQLFLKICENNNMEYTASIVTNGYLFNKFNVEKFERLKIKFAQVTLDGGKECHNKKRFLKNGDGTFDKIISNLIEVKDIFNNIAIRINTDIFNKDEVIELIEILKVNKLLDSTTPYLGYIEATNEYYDGKKCLEIEDFVQIEKKFKKALSKEINIANMSQYPAPKYNNCGADNAYSYVIDPDGNLTKCWCDIGFEEYSIGNIKEGVSKFNRLIEYFNYDIFQDEECSECSLIPVCLGGCPRKRLDRNKKHCVNVKSNLREVLLNVYKDKIGK